MAFGSETNGEPSGAIRAGARGRTEPARILVACMPKSGSTFLTDIIEALPDFKRYKLSPQPTAGRQPELDQDRLEAAGRGNFVSQEHVLYSGWTARMCEAYRLKPVVLVRSLPDAIVSFRDHFRREGGAEHLGLADGRAAGVDDAKVEAMLARFRAPWYVNFYMRWRTAPEALMISYEELIADSERTVRRVLDFAGASATDGAIARAIAKVRDLRQSRFNVGVCGRGASLQPEILRELAALFDFFPEAADDPYVKGVRAQIEAALAGRPVAPLGSVALRPPAAAPAAPSSPAPRLRRLAAAAGRNGYQITLIALALFYWVWPTDLFPDDARFGRVDDAVFLTVLAFLAGRVSKRTPALRDLPGYLSRVVSRRLRLAR